LAKNIIDSLFLELGIDTSKFSADQQKSIALIQKFEAQAKKSGKGAGDAIKTVGDAFRDLSKSSKIGAAASGIDDLSKKFKALGQSAQVAGGIGAPLGAMASGIGMLLSPTSLGIAAVGLLGKEVWDLNKVMTDSNATLARNAELTGMSATNLWSLGQAAKTVGGSPEAVQAGVASLQTALAGMSIGVGSALPQLVGMARLHRYGARFNKGGFGAGVDEESLFKAVNAMYQSQGRAKTMAFVTGYGLMSPDQANLAMSSGGWAEYKKAQSQAASMKTGGGFENVIRESLKSQVGLGENDIAGSIAAETAYGGIQQPMQTIVGLLTSSYGVLTGILNALVSPKSTYDKIVEKAKHFFGRSSDTTKGGMARAMRTLMGGGFSGADAEAIVGSLMQESAMDPLARNSKGNMGLAQWDKSRQAAFFKQRGYRMGSAGVSADQQFNDQMAFLQDELRTKYQATVIAMAKAQDLIGKTGAFMNGYERPGDNSLKQRYAYALDAHQIEGALGLVSAASRSMQVQHNDNRSDIQIGDVHLHTNATEPKTFAEAFRQGLSSQPLLDPTAQGSVFFATRGAN